MTSTAPQDARTAATEIRRKIDVDLPADDLWALIATSDGWRTWLVDEAFVDPETGHGTVIDDGRTRRVVIDTMVEGDHLTFTWWDTGDDAGYDPGDDIAASQVRIGIDHHPDGRRRLMIVERPVGLPGAALSASMSAAISTAAIRWEVRAVSLWTCSVRGTARV